jgi:DNA repair photolyase
MKKLHFFCHNADNEIVIDTKGSNVNEYMDFLAKFVSENTDQIEPKISKTDRYIRIKTKKGQVQNLCVKLGVYQIEHSD